MPEISVIVPVYNVENKIRRCIDSILAQSFTDFELILVDDSSPDLSGEICDEYAKKDVRICVIHKENGGVSSARNIGMKEADGKYIAFVDSDDYVEPEYLSVLYQGIKDAQLSICGVFFCRDGVNEKSSQKILDDACFSLEDHTGIISDLLRDRRFNYVYSKLYIREIINKNDIVFDESVSLGEDTIFVLNYLKQINSISIIGKPYYNYFRYDGNTLTTSYRENSYDQFSYINDYIEMTFRDIGILDGGLIKAIDERRLESVTWTIDSIMNQSILSRKRKEECLASAFCNESLILAIDRNTDITGSSKYYQLIRNQKVKRFISYYNSSRRKQLIIHRIKVIVVKIFPHKFIMKVKRCLQIAQ